MNSRGSISFRNGNTYSYEFPEFKIRIEKLSPHVARLWFANFQGQQIPVPPNTFLLDENNVAHNDFGGSFFITWIGSHTITRNGVVIFKTNNKKQVSVHASAEHWEVRDVMGGLRRRDGQPVIFAPLPNIIQQAVQFPQLDDDDEEDEEE
ncbi:uncharacterized protein EV422DRAFT_531767 [Fimicolochytrium jonesii]|uniref:uncharacterized protein n=1 Tax=Fimicolochytrium jonesii TaxID=1396493 RepID=UPI0022FEF725|nr:uncharacterized protein EV422DRAFT_531767 [Fimicolochytrium jonesii]KAI8820132.1 hypothetical protein EV422DRAFT_531767 [Fimicolochytrium jonesii]